VKILLPLQVIEFQEKNEPMALHRATVAPHELVDIGSAVCNVDF
jgi:hypothetical protein